MEKDIALLDGEATHQPLVHTNRKMVDLISNPMFASSFFDGIR